MASTSDSASYLDLDLEIGVGTGRAYPVAIVHSPAGEARATMQFPFDELALDNRLKDLQIALLRSGGKRRLALTQEESAVQEFGKQLFDALIVGEVRSRYDISQREAATQGKGLRLKLRIEAPQLAALPWEFLYDTRQAEFVCLSTNTPIVRYLELAQPIQPLLVTVPLRVLGMVVSPTDLPELDVTREKQRVENALKDLQTRGLVQVTWLAGQTWRELQRAMRSGTWHIFHFIGHGGFDSHADEGLIALANEDGKAEYMNATQLGRLLADHRSLRLVLLNSCEGAKGSERDLFSSTAAILVRRGIPAVLAMQYEITDRAAIEFSRSFYEAIADGLPVDAATAEARKAVSFAVTNTVEWGTPVLFMRSPDGRLFHLQPLTIVDRQAAKLEQVRAEPPREKSPGEKKRKRPANTKSASAETKPALDEKPTREPPPAPIFNLAVDLVDADTKKDWKKVIELGERILTIDPNHQPGRSKTAQAYRERGVQSHNNRDYNAAIADYTRAIELESNTADYNYLRGMSYEWKKEYASSIGDYTAAIKLDPNKPQYYYRRGVCYHHQRDYNRAIADHTAAIKLDPKKADYYQSRGNAYSWLNEYDKAIADHTKAIELDSTKPNYFWERGKRYASKHDYARALTDYNRALDLDPTRPEYYFERADAYYNAKLYGQPVGDYDRAIADYDRAIEIDPRNAENYYGRGKTYVMKQHYDRALADYNRAIQLDATKADYYQSRGNAYSWLDEYDKAIADHSKAIELDPTKANYFWERASRYTSKRDYVRAIADYDRAIKLDPTQAEYYQARGNAYSWLDEYDKAIVDHTQAIKLDATKPKYFWERGKRYSSKRDHDLAIADFSRAIQLDPTTADFYWERGKSYGWKGDWDSAKRDYRRAADMGHQDAKKALAKL